ncbi:calcium-binding protein KIC-like [Impatiens glandulifera]|uniref:calcium-binding protein KIC-like n=1 Tax=Impatiens glandulifera TaxID=253017 RepID=UPI001FB15D07|nr:calcium-binding protein KIC-like [Impatiens glandulifera]
MAAGSKATTTTTTTPTGIVFEDFFPAMVEKLGADGFMDELCKGFRLLMDTEIGAITLESLKKNSELLGLGGMSNEELSSMLREGDLDGDGCLNQMEFCVLMLRLSPELMTESRTWLDQVMTQIDDE